ncbi:MAG TPA: AMP-binding protein [Methylomirabilota bacterium]|nr:AMP-binding protein [Methylomirabilota bacterium]
MRAFFRALLRMLFGFRTFDEMVLKTPGPVLLLPNHSSWVDWLMLWVCLDEDWKFVTSSTTAQKTWLHRRIMINKQTFPIDTASPYAVKHMAELLQNNGRLVVFPEGRLSRTGVLMKLFEGTGFLLQKTNAKVITCYLRGASRILASPNNGYKLWFPKVTAHFSEAVKPPTFGHMSVTAARGKLTEWLRNMMVEQQFRIEMELGERNLLLAIARNAETAPKKVAIEDATGTVLTYKRILIGADLLAAAMEPQLSANRRVGVLLPNVNATPIVLMALWALDRTPAILNFSTGPAVMLACVKLAGLSEIITSKAFLQRAKLDISALEQAKVKIIYLEDVRAKITPAQKLGAALRLSWNPRSIGRRLNPFTPEDQPAVVLFTSGSEGVPKGVELTHKNILANIRQMLAVTDLMDNDRIFNCLPLFHSFGLTVGTLLSLVRGMFVYLYPSPLHYRVVPTVFYNMDCTVLLSTNTFLNGYARKAHPYDFRSLRYLFAAAEKLQEATSQTWSQRFGVRVLEGYGATECAPCVSVNTPLNPRYGSVGHLMPGMEARIEPVEGVEEGGRLFVRGPNIMRGYLNPDANEAFKALNGWYDTGDIVSVDADGYLHIRGRLKRFAKISGEMVSLTAVEEALAGAFPDYGLRCQIAVVSRPDAEKGEALIAVANDTRVNLRAIRQAIREKGLSNLAAPRELRYVKDIPKLGTGKVNHREIQRAIAAGELHGEVHDEPEAEHEHH